jgi:ribosomal protein S18 acetylase RimI-like enzyme
MTRSSLYTLGYRTDLEFRRFEGEIIERMLYTVIHTPKNTHYRFGNFVLFHNPPRMGDLQYWTQVFRDEHPEAIHMTFGWDDPKEAGEVQPFIDAGFEFDSSIVMTAQTVHAPSKLNLECQIRTLEPSDWLAWVDLEVAVNEAQPEADREGSGYRAFVENQASEFQRIIEAGHGHFWGAFVGDQLASSLGLFIWGEVGRFQSVVTHPDFRRRGLCGTLVYEISKRGLAQTKTLVMVADPEYVAAGIYESIGFQASEKQFSLDLRRQQQ